MKKEDIKLLIAVPSPRDIKQVLKAHDKLEEEVAYAKYLPERIAYNLLRDYFLNYTDCTHMVIAPDDLVIEQHHIDKLKQDISEYDYAVISGLCNVAQGKGLDELYSITENLPHPLRPAIEPTVPEKIRHEWGYRWYAWYSKAALKKEIQRQSSSTTKPKEIIRVWHSGFALQAIRRDIVKVIQFQTDVLEQGPGFEKMETASTDIMFSNACAFLKIPIYVDTKINMLHLRSAGDIEIMFGDYQLQIKHRDGTRETYIPKNPPDMEEIRKILKESNPNQ